MLLSFTIDANWRSNVTCETILDTLQSCGRYYAVVNDVNCSRNNALAEIFNYLHESFA